VLERQNEQQRLSPGSAHRPVRTKAAGEGQPGGTSDDRGRDRTAKGGTPRRHQRSPQSLAVGVASIGVEGQGAPDDPSEPRVTKPHREHGGRRGAGDPRPDLRGASTREGTPADQHFVEREPQCPDVHPGIGRGPRKLFGTEVRHRPARGREIVDIGEIGGYTEIEELRDATRREEDILGPHVTVNDARGVRRAQPAGYLPCHVGGLPAIQPPATESLPQVLPRVEGHRYVQRDVRGLSVPVHGREDGMLQSC
jgi:hypothetical protein